MRGTGRVAGLLRTPTALSVASFGAKLGARAGTFLLVAPLIGPERQGVLVGASAWSAVLLLVMAFGLPVRVLREVALRPERAGAVVRGDLRAMAVALAPAAVGFVLAAALLVDAYDPLVFALLFVAGIGTVAGDYAAAALRALDRYGTEARLSLAASLLQMAAAVGAAFATGDLRALAAAIALARAAYAAVALRLLLDGVGRRQDHSARAGWAIPLGATFAGAWTYFVDGSLSVLLGNIDVLLLTRLADPATLGTYSVGGRLVQLLLVVPWIAANASVPALVRARGTPGAAREERRLLASLAGVALAGAAGLVLVGPLLTRRVLGPGFAALDALWPGFAVLVLARFLEGALGILVTAAGRVGRRAVLQAAAAVLVGAIAWPAVPRLGAAGIVLATTLAYAALAALYAIRLREPGRAAGPTDRWTPVLAALIALAALAAAGIGRPEP